MMTDEELTPVERIRRLQDPLGGPWDVTFGEARESGDVVSSGYNATDRHPAEDEEST